MPFPEKSSLVKKQNELITVYEEYIKLLDGELRETILIACNYNHGWQSTKVELGIKMRQKIEQLKNDIDWLQS